MGARIKASAKIAVADRDAAEARQLFRSAGFIPLSETKRDDRLVVFAFELSDDLMFALSQAIPARLYAYRAVIGGSTES